MQEVGQPLNLIDDHKAVVWSQFLTQSAGIPTEAQVNACVEQIVHANTAKIVHNQRCFSSLAGPEKEVGFLAEESARGKKPWDI
jgi:hypothetical protein